MHNPLKHPILYILQTTSEPLKEYVLHDLLGKARFTPFIKKCSSYEALFRKHFLVMNALYLLHQDLLKQNIFLHISALDIHLEKIAPSPYPSNNSTTSRYQKLSAYYTNWNNFYHNEAKVKQLLQQFWEKYLSHDEYQQALSTLQLELKEISPDNGNNWKIIQQQYRRLCQQHHPDKGGDAVYFIQIQQAYQNLKYYHLSHIPVTD